MIWQLNYGAMLRWDVDRYDIGKRDERQKRDERWGWTGLDWKNLLALSCLLLVLCVLFMQRSEKRGMERRDGWILRITKRTHHSIVRKREERGIFGMGGKRQPYSKFQSGNFQIYYCPTRESITHSHPLEKHGRCNWHKTDSKVVHLQITGMPFWISFLSYLC